MSVSALSGINIGGNCNSGTGYDSFNIPDMRFLIAQGFRHFRVSLVSGTYTAGVNEAKQYVIDLATEMANIAAEDKTIIFGINHTPFKSTTWAADVVRIKAAAQWAQSNGATQFQISNEIDCNWNLNSETAASATRSGNTITVDWGAVPHGYITGETMQMSAKAPILNSTSSAVLTKINDTSFSFETATGGSDGTAESIAIRPSNSVPVTRLKTLATEIKALSSPAVTIPLIYSTGQGHGSQWTATGDIDKVGLNIYGEVSTSDQARFNDFKSQVDSMYANLGAAMEVHEWNLHATYGSFPANKDTQRFWIRQRFHYLESKGIKHYFYKWRSDSHAGSQIENHAAKYTWDVGGLSDGGIRWLDIITGQRPAFKDS